MVLSADVRRSYLEKVRDQEEPVAMQKLHYKGSSDYREVHRIDLRHLVFNKHNGRLESEMATWKTERDIDDDLYDDEIEDKIASLLWNDNPPKNKRTLESLKNIGQQKPGIVTLDGVVIDGNRRAMLLRKARNAWFDAIILPDAYEDNVREIVRLETEYQMGEDAKLDYGPLEKYLKVKRLKYDFDFDDDEIAHLMNENPRNVKVYLEIMELMDEYLSYIGCDGLYSMLSDSKGTKEGMFVDLNRDLKRLERGTKHVSWDYDSEVDVLLLKGIHFDHIRFASDFSDTDKMYRLISNKSRGSESFFSDKDIWDAFSLRHTQEIDPVTTDFVSLEDYCRENSEHETKTDAAKSREAFWKESVRPSIKSNFYQSKVRLENRLGQKEPTKLLQSALGALESIDEMSEDFVAGPENPGLVNRINQITYDMKKRLKKAGLM